MSTKITINVSGNQLAQNNKEKQLANRQAFIEAQQLKELEEQAKEEKQQQEILRDPLRAGDGAVPEYGIEEETSAQRRGGGGMFWVYVTHEHPGFHTIATVEKLRIAVGSTDGKSWAYADLALDFFNDPQTQVTSLADAFFVAPSWLGWYYESNGRIIATTNVGVPFAKYPRYQCDRAFVDIALPVNDQVCIYAGSAFITAFIDIIDTDLISDQQIKRLNFAFVVSGAKCRQISVPTALATYLEEIYPTPTITYVPPVGVDGRPRWETRVTKNGVIRRSPRFWLQPLDYTSAPFDLFFSNGYTEAKDRDYTPMWSYNFSTGDNFVITGGSGFFSNVSSVGGVDTFLGYLHNPNSPGTSFSRIQQYYYQNELSNAVSVGEEPAEIIVETARTGSPAIYDLVEGDVDIESDYSIVANRVGYFKADASRNNSGWATGKTIATKVSAYYEDAKAVDWYTYEQPEESPWMESFISLYDYLYLPAFLRSQSTFYTESSEQSALGAVPSGNINFDFLVNGSRQSAVLASARVLPPALFNPGETVHPLVSPQPAKYWYANGNTFYPQYGTMFHNNQLYPFAFTGWGQSSSARLLSLGFSSADLRP